MAFLRTSVFLVSQTPDCNCLASHFLSQKSGGGLVKTGLDISLVWRQGRQATRPAGHNGRQAYSILAGKACSESADILARPSVGRYGLGLVNFADKTQSVEDLEPGSPSDDTLGGCPGYNEPATRELGSIVRL
ncbi:uncharacterized protein HD556DRAFT_1534986 [Suillus plorans]|uniref:Uncharacterized protein n=1 Tax=Suillus plorans TaxID=116603 RepID=A0A9P7DLB8_9AGAM|nr:uncharacterized protein HD556DRAFT_1534986 [Suillus plorans]KAG1797694.1 hypothetical protein HD556DRAFT_1534986 [Suillus plorans]